MKQVFAKKGSIVVEEVPSPALNEYSILVETLFSAISPGTESRAIQGSKTEVSGNKIARAIQKVKDNGMEYTLKEINAKVEHEQPLGYSLVGKVIEVGKKVKNFQIGDKVACAGTLHAVHAEIVSIPENLAVKLDESVNAKEAALTALGAVAIQGIRKAAPAIGEKGIVLGLGLVGALTLEILNGTGSETLGVDISSEKIDSLSKKGMNVRMIDSELEKQVESFTQGKGADFVIVCAASSDHSAIQKALELCRSNGRIVVIGVIGLGMDWSMAYRKEITLMMSRSYGPGRYDSSYEEFGKDYPFEYVRWTENRNMQSYIDLLKSRKINVEKLVDKTFPIDQSKEAYEELKNKTTLTVLIQYSPHDKKIAERVVFNHFPLEKNAIHLGIIGPGHFFKAIHAPNLVKEKAFQVVSVSSASGSNARDTGKFFNASEAGTNYKQLLDNKDVDAVFISTPPETHSKIVIDCLEKNKHVFVEKPICTSRDELTKIEEALKKNSKQILLIGHNRRFSPISTIVKKQLNQYSGPTIVNYFITVPPLDGKEQAFEGGRIIEEMTHFFDYANFLTSSTPEKVSVHPIGKVSKPHSLDSNLSVVLHYPNGSLATIVMNSLGSPIDGKEKIDILKGGNSISILDFKSYSINGKKTELPKAEKGWKEELDAFKDCLQGKKTLNEELASGINATKVAFDVIEKLKQSN